MAPFYFEGDQGDVRPARFYLCQAKGSDISAECVENR